VTGTREEIRRAAGAYGRGTPDRQLLDAVVAHRDGDVDSAVRLLRRIIRTWDPARAAPAADLLGPILVMRRAPAELSEVAAVLDSAGWRGCAEVFRALAAAQSGDRRGAMRHSRAATRALETEMNPIIEVRMLQRLASVAYFINDHTQALDLAVRSGRLGESVGAWHNAAAAYSIAYNVYHDVLEDFLEADRVVQLWRRAARKTGDVSFLQPAIVAEFTIAVQMAEADRIPALGREIRGLSLPEQYTEHFALTLAHAMVRGLEDLGGMRTLLAVLQDTAGRSRAERAVCIALIAMADAAQRDDEAARLALREAIGCLGRAASTEPAFERRLRRLARATIAFTCEIIGDHVHASRILTTRESAADDSLRDLVHGAANVAPGLQGLQRLYARVRKLRTASEPPAGLSPAELEILRLLGKGWSAVEIARETGRSRHTIYKHTQSIRGKLDAHRSSQAVAIARDRGFLS
jgi:DNA-binding CsgD family transcriptional regulator/tetratricopeptide (TPR) repeat protein